MKRFCLTIFLTLLLTIGVCAEIHSGRSGSASTWQLDTESGVLEIFGTGSLNNFNSPTVFEREIGAGTNSRWVIEYIGGEETPSTVVKEIGSGYNATWVLEYTDYNCVEREIGSGNNATWVLEYTDYNCVEREIGSGYNATWVLEYTDYPCVEREIGSGNNNRWVLDYTDYYSYEREIGTGNNATWYLIQGLAPWLAYEYDTVKIPAGITKIDENSAFYCEEFIVDENNPNYVSVDGVLFSKDMTELIRYPVYSTATEYTIPESVKRINYFAFNDAENLTEINIPDSVTYIGDFAFAGCSNLNSMILPQKLREIKRFTFYNCYSLYALTIPKYVTKIHENTFWQLDIFLEVYENSYAEAYAITNNLPFYAMNDPGEKYFIESLSLMNSSYDPISSIPSESFIAEVNITNLCSDTKDYILIACYDSDNRLVDIDFMYALTLAGQTVTLGTHIKNEKGNIAKIQAFVLSDLKSFKILAESVEIS